ncbi:MAG: DUF502 domain-containing protein [Planctomycetota bacterium]
MKRFFFGGLTALLPTILTLWIVVALFGFVRDYIAIPVTHGIQWCLVTNRPGQLVLESMTGVDVFDPARLDPTKVPAGADGAALLASLERDAGLIPDLSLLDHARLQKDLDAALPPVVGLLIGLVGIFVIGFYLRLGFGRLLFSWGERLLASFPFIKTIYPYAKKIVEFFFSERTVKEFRSVVAVPYPSQGLFTIGFVTSAGLASLDCATDGDFVSVFLPSSPTPMTGYVVFVPREEVVPLNLTFDQAMALIISGGAIVPEGELCRQDRRRREAADVDAAPALLPERAADVSGAASASEPSGA